MLKVHSNQVISPCPEAVQGLSATGHTVNIQKIFIIPVLRVRDPRNSYFYKQGTKTKYDKKWFCHPTYEITRLLGTIL